MRISELIAVLAQRLAESGDLEVTYPDHESGECAPIGEVLWTKGTVKAGTPAVDVFLLKELA